MSRGRPRFATERRHKYMAEGLGLAVALGALVAALIAGVGGAL